MTRHLCLNGIVKNEAARIVRMLDSVKDHIATFAILDTGSTDGTIELIQQWADQHGIRGIVGVGSFVNFSQARNDALQLARSWWRKGDTPKFSYLLLADADMELVVEQPDVFANLIAPAYELIQKAGGTSYSNVRIVHVGPEFKYLGVTHEYLDCGGSSPLVGAHFLDYADGSNRKDKFRRDIKLLLEDLERDPRNPRSWFYLANSYRDCGEYTAAVDAYRKRVTLGGWDEEIWNAQVNLANCLEKQGLEDAYVKETLAAYAMRPSRAEPLHALAKHFRFKNQPAIAMMFVREGMSVPRPNDRLFIEDWVYDWGFKEEFSISGFYNERTRSEAAVHCGALAMNPRAPWHARQGARNNMAWYLMPLTNLCPSTRLRKLDCVAEDGFTAMNPCIASRPDGDVEVLVRTVNYKINEHGQYMIGEKGCQDAPIVTRNWLVHLNRDLSAKNATLVHWDRPEPKFELVIGLEDMRVFYRDGTRYFLACVREQSGQGQCEQWTGQLDNSGVVSGAHRVSDGVNTEKNWLPWIDDRYVYRLDKLIDIEGNVEKIERNIAVDNISGSSQWIPFSGGLLSVVHESLTHPATGKRVYQHRFAWISQDFQDLKLSTPFVFQHVQIEFCAGLARTPGGTLLISFGVRDEEAWICEIATGEVRCALGL